MFGEIAAFNEDFYPIIVPSSHFSQNHQSSTATAESFGNADEQTTKISET